MYAIVNIAGQQMKVEKDQQLYVNRVAGNEGDDIRFDEVLLVDNDGKVNVGAPAISGAVVTAKVVEHLKGDKVIVFKKKRRKGYQKRNGHRQLLTKISITGIELDGKKKAEKPAAEAKPKAAEKPAEAKKTEAKAEPKKTEAKADTKKAESKAETKKTETKKADDLTVIEGVGPKISEVLSNAGIKSFADLAKAKVEKLNEILSEAGSAYASHNPETWPEQAKLAAAGKFDELKEWQDKLDGGVDRS